MSEGGGREYGVRIFGCPTPPAPAGLRAFACTAIGDRSAGELAAGFCMKFSDLRDHVPVAVQLAPQVELHLEPPLANDEQSQVMTSHAWCALSVQPSGCT